MGYGMNLETAQALQAEAIEALDPDQVLVTLNQAEMAPALAAGQQVVLIPPPATSSPTGHQVVATWQLYLVSGPQTDLVAAWANLDALLVALAEVWDWPDQTLPAEWSDLAGSPWPALTCTITTHHDR